MDETRNYISMIFQGYKKRKIENKLYNDNKNIPKIIIENYIKYVNKPSFKSLIDSYKKKYIYYEARVESNIRKEEQLGLAEVYDFIQSFDFSKNSFNVFITSLLIHQKLYSHSGKEFGGTLRDNTAILYDLNIEVSSPNEAKKIFNSYISKGDFLLEKLNKGDVFGYINDCIKLNVELIKLQPFADGNKRTFRALTNLLFKRLNIPPIYIQTNERAEYKKVLIKAMNAKCEEDYNDIIQFYYYKICDAIVTLDINNSEIHTNLSKQK